MTISQLSQRVFGKSSGLWAGFEPKHASTVDPDVQLLTDHLVRYLGKRDQVFFIEDSDSMKRHVETVKQTFMAFASIAAKIDPDEVELVFASDPQKVYRGRKELMGIVAKHKFRHHGPLMEDKFGSFIRSVIIPGFSHKKNSVYPRRRRGRRGRRRRRTSVYIFTDGEWGGQKKASGVQRPIKELMTKLEECGLERTYISLHFVAFGDSKTGERNLTFIDDFGKEESW
jgi:hypothetical protein